ncbi:MAG TPA: beta-ketoacyl-[acyl-carrier-protein] synthase family protein [Chthoniobacterales bacterium]|jgi:3-oxoacyl-[acyl-carrier-protein] synthase II|nr:beta-ketoacyl-[acyl-carrier-protein] synthase family protein [Chthoniobacterales bacterium]
MRKHNRVVVTGMGILAPNGIGLEAFWDSLVAGRSGVGPITHFDASAFKSRIAGEVKGFEPLDYIDPKFKPKRMARHTQFAFAAMKMALRDADFDPAKHAVDHPIPVMLGVSTTAMDILEDCWGDLSRRGPRGVTAGVVDCQPQAATQMLTMALGISARATTIASACPSGLDAIASAAAMIRQGEADIAVAGGTDATITPLSMASFAAAGLSSTRNTEPTRASRPFDLLRDSGIISEGAGMLILENYETAIARGASPYLEIIGYGTQGDNYTSDELFGLASTMRMALNSAGKTPEDIDYICAYGPGHPALDVVETDMIKRVFGRRAYGVPISSIKGVTGNALSAAGPHQLITCALCFKHNIIPPTANYEVSDPRCDLDFVPGRFRSRRINTALINVRGLGGGNSSMVVERASE